MRDYGYGEINVSHKKKVYFMVFKFLIYLFYFYFFVMGKKKP